MASAKWDGESLRLCLKRDLAPGNDRQIETIRTISLAPDGKTMTSTVMVRQYPGGRISMLGNEVWARQ